MLTLNIENAKLKKKNKIKKINPELVLRNKFTEQIM